MRDSELKKRCKLWMNLKELQNVQPVAVKVTARIAPAGVVALMAELRLTITMTRVKVINYGRQ